MLTTQCPQCQTRFKVSDAQLAVADGFVRCGRCAHVFNAQDALVAIPQPSVPPAPSAPAAPPRTVGDDFELELPDFTPDNAGEAATPAPIAPPVEPPFDEPAPAPTAEAQHDSELAQFQQALADALRAPRAESRPIELPEPPAPPEAPLGMPFETTPGLRSQRTPAAATETGAPVPPAPETPAASDDVPPPDTPPLLRAARPRRVYAPLLFGLGGMLGLLLLCAQLLYLNRTRASAEIPELRPTLEALCAGLGCNVPLPTDRNQLRTEWSELAYVPDQPGLVQFTATLKNHARYPQAWPAMELTLTDSDERVLVRRVFAPAVYLPKAEQGKPAFAAGAQVKVLLRLNAAQLKQNDNTLGYSVNWLYP